MSFILIAVLIISIWGIRVRKCNIDEHMSLLQTSTINGIFVMFVFLRHFGENIEFSTYDKLLRMVDNRLGQAIVTTFLLYSGYGIMYSVINKNNYIKSLPKRSLKLLMQFDIAIILYLIVSLILKQSYSPLAILLSFVGWASVGNSSWYIFAILCLYIITYISGIICKDKHFLLIVLVTAGCLAYIVLLHIAGRPQYCYDTILCFPAGMLYALYSKQLFAFLSKSRINPFLYFLLAAIVFFTLYYCEKTIKSQLPHLGLLELRNVSFAILMVALTTIFVVGNKTLAWLGKYVFEIYILQRIPMNLFKSIVPNKYIYFVICAIVTLVLAIAFKQLTAVIDSSVLKKAKKD